MNESDGVPLTRQEQAADEVRRAAASAYWRGLSEEQALAEVRRGFTLARQLDNAPRNARGHAPRAVLVSLDPARLDPS